MTLAPQTITVIDTLPTADRDKLNRVYRLRTAGAPDKHYVCRKTAAGVHEWFELGRDAPTFDIRDFGAVSNDVTKAATNDAAFAAAVGAAKVAGDVTLGAVVLIPPGEWFIATPIVLPRTGATPTNVVHLIGEHIRTATIRGSNTAFPANRALIEWEAVSSRAWHQRIARLKLTLPNVAGTMAIHHKKNSVGVTLTDYTTEWLQLDLEDLDIETNNTFHQAAIKLEIGNRFAVMENVFHDPAQGTDPTFDTLLFDVAFQVGATNPTVGNDSVGLGQCVIRNVTTGLRRGGFARMLKGRIHSSVWDGSFAQGPGVENPVPANMDLLNCSQSALRNTRFEGYSDNPQIRLTRGHYVTIDDYGLGTPNPKQAGWTALTAYVIDDLVISPLLISGASPTTKKLFKCTTAGTSGAAEPTWNDVGTTNDGTVVWTAQGDAIGNGIDLIDCHHCRISRRSCVPGANPFSLRLVKVVTIDADSDHNAFLDLNLNETGAGAFAGELTVSATEAKRNVLAGVGVSGSAGSPTYTPFVLGWHPGHAAAAAPTAKTTTYTGLAGDETVACDATGGAFTVTLPPAAGLAGKVLTIKKTDASANAVTVDGNAAETIDGATTKTLTKQHEALVIVSNGTNWLVLAARNVSENQRITGDLEDRKSVV